MTTFMFNLARNTFARGSRSGRSPCQSTNSEQRSDVDENVAREEGRQQQTTSEVNAPNIPRLETVELRETFRRNVVVTLPDDKEDSMTVTFDHLLIGPDLITQRACDRLGLEPITSYEIPIKPMYSGLGGMRETRVAKVVQKLNWHFQGESRKYENDFWVSDIQGSDAILSYDSVANNRYLVGGNIPPCYHLVSLARAICLSAVLFSRVALVFLFPSVSFCHRSLETWNGCGGFQMTCQALCLCVGYFRRCVAYKSAYCPAPS